MRTFSIAFSAFSTPNRLFFTGMLRYRRQQYGAGKQTRELQPFYIFSTTLSLKSTIMIIDNCALN
jgi:hypothetical protein